MIEISSQLTPKICDTFLAEHRDFLRKIYTDLLNDITHHPSCPCPSCLYQFHRLRKKHSKKKETRIRKKNFFFYWLAYLLSDDIGQPKLLNHNENRKRYWKVILPLYLEITEDERFSYSDLNEPFRIISRLDKTANISELELAKETAATLAPVYISPLFEEIRRIFEIIKKHNSKLNFPHPSSLPSQTYKIIYVMINSIKKVMALLIKKKKPLTIREISRGCHIKHSGLLMILDYAEKLKIIIQDKTGERFFLSPDWSFWCFRYLSYLNFIAESMKSLNGISIESARRAFLEQIDRIMRFYRESKRYYRLKNMSKM